MARIALKDVLNRMASRILDVEDVLYGDPTPFAASMTATLHECAAETEIEHRRGRPLHARGTECRLTS